MKNIIIAGVLLMFFSVSCSTNPVANNYSDAIEFGGEWFLTNQYDEGFLHYEYNINTEKYSRNSHSLREMGALWSIASLSNYLDDIQYDALAQKGFSYFENSFVFDEENDFIYVAITDSKIKLGYSAFAILSLLEIDHSQKDYYLEKLANGMISMQEPDGSLRTFFFSDRNTGVDYYPGEALLALISLYEKTGDESYLEVVEKAFPYYREYWRNNQNTAFIPWQTRTYEKLYNVNGDQEVADFIFEMNDYMLADHNPELECSDFDFSRGIVAAVFMEGVIKAYEVAQITGDTNRANCYSNFVKEGANFISSLQINSPYIPDEHAIGGFLGSYKSQTLRVDRNQHSVMALMDGIEAGILD